MIAYMKTKSQSSSPRLLTLFFTIAAMIAFAANSVLAKLALNNDNIDAISFTMIRLLSGAIMLFILVIVRDISSSKNKALNKVNQTSSVQPIKGSWPSAIMLFIYAAGFSIAYLSLDTGTGALILFGAVQITIVITNIYMGQPMSKQEWLGMILAFAGFVLLVLPSLSTPSLAGFILMAVAGIAWAGYTLRGRTCKDPLADTSGNFIKSVPFGLLLLTYFLVNDPSSIQSTSYGLVLAVLSGAITSGVGYAMWYVALRNLTGTQAGVLQLTVPVIAAAGGAIFLSEAISTTFIISSVMILGGILLITLSKKAVSKK